MRKCRRIDSGRASHTKTVIPDTEIKNCAIVVGSRIKQGDEGIAIPKSVVQSFHRHFQTTGRKRASGIQRIPQFARVSGVGVDYFGNLIARRTRPSCAAFFSAAFFCTTFFCAAFFCAALFCTTFLSAAFLSAAFFRAAFFRAGFLDAILWS